MGNLFGPGGEGKPAKSATPVDKGKAAVKKDPNNVLGGYTEKTRPDGTTGKISSGGFIDDGAKRMPGSTDAYAKALRAKLSARGGRGSTDLTGTRSYVNNWLGGVN